jgi:metal-responsive CopG/Arc/MetJ family transcriptional regulator
MSTSRITLSLPRDLLREVERWRRETGESRSEFVRRALTAALAGRERDAAVDRYLRGYELHPETTDEIAEVGAIGLALLAEEPWE